MEKKKEVSHIKLLKLGEFVNFNTYMNSRL